MFRRIWRRRQERMAARRVAVVGGGVSGLVAALALQQVGYRVTVFERSSAAADDLRSVTLTGRDLRALDDLAVGGEVLRESVPFLQEVVSLGAAPAPRGWEPQSPQDARIMPRVVLRTILEEHSRLAGVEIERGRGVLSVIPSGAVARLHLEGGGVRTARHVIGADGPESAVRASLIAGRSSLELPGGARREDDWILEGRSRWAAMPRGLRERLDGGATLVAARGDTWFFAQVDDPADPETVAWTAGARDSADPSAEDHGATVRQGVVVAALRAIRSVSGQAADLIAASVRVGLRRSVTVLRDGVERCGPVLVIGAARSGDPRSLDSGDIHRVEEAAGVARLLGPAAR